jgi:hypothetical protein
LIVDPIAHPVAKSALTRARHGVSCPSSPTKWGQVVSLGGGRRALGCRRGHRSTHRRIHGHGAR